MTLEAPVHRRPADRSSRRPEVVPASTCSLVTLTEIYNATRVDYLVPMPMSVEAMGRHVARYDVDLEASLVAVEAGDPAGLALLGVRGSRGWVTRLGVVPEKRRSAIGSYLVSKLVETARARGLGELELEVIRENRAARRMFARAGFRSVRELLVASREAGPPDETRAVQAVAVSALGRREIEALLASRGPGTSWLTQRESLLNMERLRGFEAVVDGRAQGWIAFREGSESIDHVILGAAAQRESGVGLALLDRLHATYPEKRATVQNVPADAPSVSLFRRAGYTEDFRRIQMRCDLGESGLHHTRSG